MNLVFHIRAAPPRRAAALARAEGPQRAKRYCRRSSCRRLRPPPRWTGSRSRAWTAQTFPGNPGSAPALPRLWNKAKPSRLGLGPAPGDEDGDEWPIMKGMGPCYIFPSLGAGSLARQGSAGARGTVVPLGISEMAQQRGPVCRCALCERYTHRYTQSLALRAEFIGFFIGFSTATTQISTHFPNSCNGKEEEGIRHSWGRQSPRHSAWRWLHSPCAVLSPE